jgi:hypothetical protein
MNDLSHDGGSANLLKQWRGKLIERLKDRPEGFVRNGALASGRKYPAFLLPPIV